MKPQLVVFAGPNGSGKTTLYYKRFAQRSLNGIEYVNPDEFTVKHNSEIRGAREALQRRNQLIADNVSFVTETTLSGSSALRLLVKAKQAGYTTTLIYIGTHTQQLNIERVDLRVKHGGHQVSDVDIARRYQSSIGNLDKALSLANIAHVYNSNGGTRRLFSVRNGVIKPRAGIELPAWVPEVVRDKVLSASRFARGG